MLYGNHPWCYRLQDVRTLLGVLMALVALHALMQQYHSTRCRANLFRIILYSETPTCRYLRYGMMTLEDVAYASVGLIVPIAMAPLTGLLRRSRQPYGGGWYGSGGQAERAEGNVGR
jgi:hypothetical protein